MTGRSSNDAVDGSSGVSGGRGRGRGRGGVSQGRGGRGRGRGGRGGGGDRGGNGVEGGGGGRGGGRVEGSRGGSGVEGDDDFGEFSCLSCLSCCFGCVWECFQLWTPLSATFILYWLIYRPDHFHPHIDSAALAALDLTNASAATPAPALRYDLAVQLSFQNTRRVAIKYLDVAASVFYDGTMLGPTDDALPSFYQGPKNTTIFHPKFHGVVTVDSAVAAELQRELDAGTVHIRVTVSLTLMYKVLFVRDVFFYKYDCWLWFPPPRNHTPALFPANGGTKCWRMR